MERRRYLFFMFMSFSLFLSATQEHCYKQIIKEIMIPGIICLTHDDICALALVDKSFNQKIKKTASLRKNYLEKHAPAHVLFVANRFITWHINGSAYALIGATALNGFLGFGLVHLKANGVGWIQGSLGSNVMWVNDQRYPRFNSKGEAFVHTIKPFIRSRDEVFDPYKFIVESSLSISGSLSEFCCVMDLKDSTPERFMCLLGSPTLLEAILQSTQVYESCLNSLRGTYCGVIAKSKRYNLKGVTIPDDFKTFKKDLNYGQSLFVDSFDQLPDPMKEAILDRYEEQKAG